MLVYVLFFLCFDKYSLWVMFNMFKNASILFIYFILILKEYNFFHNVYKRVIHSHDKNLFICINI